MQLVTSYLTDFINAFLLKKLIVMSNAHSSDINRHNVKNMQCRIPLMQGHIGTTLNGDLERS